VLLAWKKPVAVDRSAAVRHLKPSKCDANWEFGDAVETPHSFQGPHRNVRASELMIFVYLDEFGHIGPFDSRAAPKHNESPVFGLAGMILPERAVRPFASYFLKQKEFHFADEIKKAKKMAAKWEKKGTSFIRPKPIAEYVEARRVLHRVLKKIDELGGNVFYYGREKIVGAKDLNSVGLYTTCLSHALRNLDAICESKKEPFVVVVDQHSARKELLECAAKTMFGKEPCKNLASPPFEVESYINQNIQAADWIATLVGRILAYRTLPDQFADHEGIDRIFGSRLQALESGCVFEKRVRRPDVRPRRLHHTAMPDPNHPFAALAKLRRDPK
jgi:hypothetical protein